MPNILIVKETRAGETRVALVPNDVKVLVENGYTIYLEHHAGLTAGFSDQDYENVGAQIRTLRESNTLDDFKKLFADIDIIARVKRPNREREIRESQAFAPGTMMIGALDPLEKNSSHMEEYRHANLTTHSIDQLNLDADDSMNVLAAMSKIAGRLALLDAIKQFKSPINKVVLIGFGTVGKAAFDEAIKNKLATTVVIHNRAHEQEIITRGGHCFLLEKNQDVTYQQEQIKPILLDADIVIASARKAKEPAPLLIPAATLQQMKQGTVVVDLALSEGGNVEGSEHDQTHLLGNNVIVTNVSGYPKALPHEASKLWSRATLLFIQHVTDKNEITGLNY